MFLYFFIQASLKCLPITYILTPAFFFTSCKEVFKLCAYNFLHNCKTSRCYNNSKVCYTYESQKQCREIKLVGIQKLMFAWDCCNCGKIYALISRPPSVSRDYGNVCCMEDLESVLSRARSLGKIIWRIGCYPSSKSPLSTSLK